jgi:hypothetical protein
LFSCLRPRQAATLIAVSSLAVGLAGWTGPAWGFAAVVWWYGVVEFTQVLVGAWLQHGVRGEARATVTSVAGFGGELAVIAMFVTIAAMA